MFEKSEGPSDAVFGMETMWSPKLPNVPSLAGFMMEEACYKETSVAVVPSIEGSTDGELGFESGVFSSSSKMMLSLRIDEFS